jgi:hypothetical protein
VSLRTGIAEEDPDLAVIDAACGARVLALDPARVLAFLEKTGLIENRDPVWIVEMLDDQASEFVADIVGFPDSAVKQMLDAIGIVMADIFGQLPSILSFDGTEQSFKIVMSLLTHFLAREAGIQSL